jgi:crotonobetainyl-CoA:carnitine CoA-transferase CaiB-like acyl-CoA transferase
MKELDTIIGNWTRQYEGEPLEEMLLSASVPASRVFTIADIYKDPHFVAREMLVKVAHPTLGHTTQAGVVPKLSRTPGSIKHTGPSIGADTRNVLQDIGLTQEQINTLIEKGIVNAA